MYTSSGPHGAASGLIYAAKTAKLGQRGPHVDPHPALAAADVQQSGKPFYSTVNHFMCRKGVKRRKENTDGADADPRSAP